MKRIVLPNGHVVSDEYNFKAKFPELAKEWDYEKNINLVPENFTPKSNVKVWWKCLKKKHSWRASIDQRSTYNSKCPYCGNKHSKENNLLVKNPIIAKYWHPTLNGTLTPADVTPFSGKKVWWLCENNHSSKSSINSKVRSNRKCNECLGRVVNKLTSLKAKFPKLIKEWDFDKNKDLDPSKIHFGSGKYVWWLCNRKHSFYSRISHRTHSKTRCPYCMGQKLTFNTSLEYFYPNVAKEWDYEKNSPILPSEVTAKTSKKFWWKCIKGHYWKAKVSDRTTSRGTGTKCPFCFIRSSTPELRVYAELLNIFTNVKSRYQFKKKEIDIFLQDFNIGLEYDGVYYHKNFLKKDLIKNKFLKDNNVILIRLREKPLEKTQPLDILIDKEIKKSDIDELLKVIKNLISDKDIVAKIDKYINQIKFQNDLLLNKLVSEFPLPVFENSIEFKRPEILKAWDYKKNDPLTPRFFTAGSNKKVYWICMNCKQSTLTKIFDLYKRNRFLCRNCDFKSNAKYNSRSIKHKYPQLLDDWNYNKNADLRPENINLHTEKKVWWRCPKGHEEYRTPLSKFKNSCLVCFGKRKISSR
jgi:hypothetical protein